VEEPWLAEEKIQIWDLTSAFGMWMEEWRVGRSKRASNVVGMKGGKYFVADRDYDRFLDGVMRNSESCKLYLVEQAGTICRFFVDYDALGSMEQSEAAAEALEDVVTQRMGMTHKALIKWRDNSTSFHMVFPTLVVHSTTRRVLTHLLHAADPCVDVKASGLRLPGSWGAKGQEPYGPLHPDFSIHAPAEAACSTLLRQRAPQLSTGLAVVQADADGFLIDKVRKAHPAWKTLVVDKQRETEHLGLTNFTVRGPGQTVCLLQGGKAHTSNRIRFTAYSDNRIKQFCFKCKGGVFI